MKARGIWMRFLRVFLGTIWERETLGKLLGQLVLLLGAIMGFYCIADISLNQRSLQSLTPLFLAENYGCQFIKRLPQLLPLCAALCALRTLASSRESGEFVALNSSGISLRRLSAPFLRFGIFCSFWGACAFEVLYPMVAGHLRQFEQKNFPHLNPPHILYLKSRMDGTRSCLVYSRYQPNALSESSGVFQRGFFRHGTASWIYFDSMQFFQNFAHIHRSIRIDFGEDGVRATRKKSLLIEHQFDLAGLSRQAIPPEDLGLLQLRQAARQLPSNSFLKAYFHYRLQQVGGAFWSVLCALFISLRSRPGRNSLITVQTLFLTTGLEAISRVILILSGYHLLQPLWIWLPFALPLALWLAWLRKR